MRLSTVILFLALGAWVCPALAKAQGPSTQVPAVGMPMHNMAAPDVSALIDKLEKSAAAIEAERHPAARREKLAEHAAVLKELKAKIESSSGGMGNMSGHMMGNMSGDMNCCNMSGNMSGCGSQMTK